MKLNPFAIASALAGVLVIAGCGDSAPATPDPSAAGADQSKEATTLATSELIGQAQGLYGEAKQAIARSDVALAKSDVDQLVAMRSRLPADWQAKVDELSKALAAKGK